MKRRWIITLVAFPLMCAVVFAVALLVEYRRHTVPLEDCSEVYRRYRDFPGIRAAFIKDKQINDTLRLDMTLLQAEDSMAFIELLKNWNKSDELIEYMMTHIVDSNTCHVADSPRGHPELPRDPIRTNNDILAIFPARLSAAVFHINSVDNELTVAHSLYRKLVNIP